MADLVVGLAKSVVGVVLTKAQAAIEEEGKLRKSAQRDLVFIAGEFQMMQSFLNVANEERVGNKVVRTWVSQVRELAYDVEDCIELVLHLDHKNRCWFRLVPSWSYCVIRPCMGAPKLDLALMLDTAVDEIEQVKARVADVSKRNARYNLISDSGSKPVVMHHHPPSEAAVGSVAASSMLVEARGAARRRKRFGDLSRLITERNDDPQLQVISVWGAGGDHGTTSIIRKAYNDAEICKNFNCRAWVKLMHPFNPREFVRAFISQDYSNTSQDKDQETIGTQVVWKMEATQEDLFKEFEQLVTKKRYLVVLEDVSDMIVWDAVRTFLPDRNNGSCIVVSTQQSEIAGLCIGHPYQILELRHFSPQHSVCALFKKDPEGKKGMTREDSRILSPVLTREASKTLSPEMKMAKEWMDSSPLVGRNTLTTELGKYPAKARTNSNPVMSVWGIAGVGKSAVVRYLYYDRVVNGPLYQNYVWVDVSHPFNLRDLYQSLVLESHPEKYLIEEYCRDLVQKERCLIVIDGLQSTEEWDLIQASLVLKSSRSVIIVVTTNASIARYCTKNEDLVFNVKALEDAAAIELFKNQAFKRNPISSLKDDEVQEVDELIRRCGGLPKVMDAIAGLMATQTTDLMMKTVRSLNNRFMQLLETDPEYDILLDVFRWMHSYFRTCSDSLKPCIIYLTIFPRDKVIRRRRLVRRWIAEGYSRDSHNESAEKNGEDQFSELLELSIIQQSPHLEDSLRGMVRCLVNGFIREYIVSRQMEDNLVFELGGKCALTTQRTGRHLVVLNDWTRDTTVFESIDFSLLRSLTVFGKWGSFFISESMKMLRVLDLEDAEKDLNYSDLKMMVKHLRRLKFLSLRGHTEITRLPTSLGYLRHLQSLDVRHTSVVNLPKSITKLEKLQYFRAGSADALEETSGWRCLKSRWHSHLVGVKGMGKLTALHTLGVVNVGASEGEAMEEELKKLTQLRKLGVSGINKDNSNKFFSAISKYGHLESLSVQFDKESQCSFGAIDLPWESLRSLKLNGLQDKLPLFHHSLPGNVNKPENVTKLTKLILEMDTLNKVDIEFLARLPKLCILRLHVNQPGLRFYDELYELEVPSFGKVKILEIACSSRLELTFASQTMKSLEVLKLNYSLPTNQPGVNQPGIKISAQINGLEVDSFEKVKILEIGCSSSFKLTFGSKTMKRLELLKLDYKLSTDQLPKLDDLHELKEVLLKDTNDEAIKTALKNQLAEHPKKPVLKLF